MSKAVIADAVVRDGDRVLIAWHTVRHRWSFPGGHALAGETPAETAIRECREETGLRVRAIGPLAQVKLPFGVVHSIACELVSHGQLLPSGELAALHWATCDKARELIQDLPGPVSDYLG
jgi:8-oxo-dGTP diphosphatase